MYNPQPPPQNYGYGSPYGAPPAHLQSTLPGAEPGAKTSLGIEGNAAGALAYIGPFNIIFAVIEKENRFVRFNAFQSLFLGLTLLAVDFIVMIVGMVLAFLFIAANMPGLVAVIWMLFAMLLLVLSVLALVGIVMAAIKAYQRQMLKLPVVGNWAENIAKK